MQFPLVRLAVQEQALADESRAALPLIDKLKSSLEITPAKDVNSALPYYTV